MKPIFQQLLVAYQPLRQRGLLLDDRRPSIAVPPIATDRRRRGTLMALACACRAFFHSRNQP